MSREIPSEFRESDTPMFARGSDPLTDEQLEKQARMAIVFAHLRDVDVSTLQRRFVERMTLAEMAKEDGVTYQAVQQQVVLAVRRFKHTYAAYWKEGGVSGTDSEASE